MKVCSTVAATMIHKLTAEQDLGGCFQELRDATAQWDRKVSLETVLARVEDIDPPRSDCRFGTPHGWQHCVSSFSDHFFRRTW